MFPIITGYLSVLEHNDQLMLVNWVCATKSSEVESLAGFGSRKTFIWILPRNSLAMKMLLNVYDTLKICKMGITEFPRRLIIDNISVY